MKSTSNLVIVLIVINVTNQEITSSIMCTLTSNSDVVTQFMISTQFLISPQLTLPGDAQPRLWHTITALSLQPGRTQVTVFGGSPKWESGKSDAALQKLAKTTVLEFGEQNTIMKLAPSVAIFSLYRVVEASSKVDQLPALNLVTTILMVKL